MKACILSGAGRRPALEDRPKPIPADFDVLIRVEACGVCRTDLHVLDGDLPSPKYPLVLGHEIVGIVEAVGERVEALRQGDRVGIPWLASACLQCDFCRRGQENLCDKAKFTGYTVDGGFAEYTLADSRFCFSVPASYDAQHAAPLLCAGLIGWRCMKFTGDAVRVGLYGFGAAAHVITPLAIHDGRKIFAFTSPGDTDRQEFARSLGAAWAGGSDQAPAEELDAAILFAPVGALLPIALNAVRKGGTVVCGGIHMSDIPSFPYSLLWGERTVRSVANLTRADGKEFFERVSEVHIETHITPYSLEQTNQAIDDFRGGKIHGAAVLVPN